MTQSIAVTERAIRTLKHEWMKRVPLLKGFDHLAKLCDSFLEWYNAWRPYMMLDGGRTEALFFSEKRSGLSRNAKTVPYKIECRVFQETRVTGYRFKTAA